MTPIRQTIFVADNPEGWGNCMSACLASILDRPLSEVINVCDPKVRENGFWPPIIDWLEEQGYAFEIIHDFKRVSGKYSIGSGPSPRGNFYHTVICYDGKVVFDPHPSDEGLKVIKMHFLITKQGEI